MHLEDDIGTCLSPWGCPSPAYISLKIRNNSNNNNNVIAITIIVMTTAATTFIEHIFSKQHCAGVKHAMF